jgi:uncharacterized protein YndB with AHSA1/START domain
MASVEREFSVDPHQVWATLADGWLYSTWVVGTSHLRAVEADWPAVGSRLFHATGLWPAVIRDETVVEVSEPGALLVLVARGWPAGQARVTLALTPTANGTHVVLEETPIAGPGRWLHNPVNEAILVRRNKEALQRLAAAAERRTSPAD